MFLQTAFQRGMSILLTYALLLIVAFSSGCGFHLHNPADESLAKKASDSFKAADVGKFVTSERAVVQAANERDMASLRRNIDAERDALIIAALSDGQTAKGLLEEVDRRQTALGFPNDPAVQKTLYSIPFLRQVAMHSRDLYLIAILESPKPMKSPAFPPSAEDEAAANQVGGKIKDVFDAFYKKDSVDYVEAMGKLEAVVGGEIGELNKSLKDAAELESKVKFEGATAKTNLDAAVKAYKAALADEKKTPQELQSALDAVTNARKQFETLVPKLEAEAKNLHLEDLVADLRLQQLKAAEVEVGEFLDGFAEQSNAQTAADAKTGEGKADRAGRAAAIIVNAAETIREADTRAKLIPLVFEQGRLKIEVARLERKLQRGRSRIDLLEKERDQAVAEGMKLLYAHNLLTAAHAGTPDATIESLLGGKSKGDVVNAVFVLGESVGINRFGRESAATALVTLDHDEALDASEFALELWQFAIATPLDALLSYHAAGLKPEDVANLIQAAGLAGVAVGVNR